MHYLIKNILLDRKKDDNVVMPTLSVKQSYFEGFLPNMTNKNSNDPIVLKDVEKQRMMQYISQAENEDDTELNAVFSQKIITECTTKEPSCPVLKKDDDQLPLSTTCDANIQLLKKTDDMKMKADCQLQQDHKSFTVIKEYENEKSLNGGQLFDGLGAFDSYEDYFQTYSSTCGVSS